MNLTLRLTVTLGLLTAVLVTAARSPGLPGRPAPAPPTPEPCTRLVLPPSEEVLILARRSEAKAGVVEKLLADELTLVEAAAWFHRLNSEPPSQPCESWKLVPGDTPEEKVCRQVIRWAEADPAYSTSPGRFAALLCRLEEQLQAQLARGAIELPRFGEVE